MYTTAEYMGKRPIITEVEQATQKLIAARKRLTDTTFAFHTAVKSNLPEKRVELVEEYTNEDRRNGNKDLRWLRYQQFMQSEALNNVGYTRVDLLAAKEEYELSVTTLRALLKEVFDASSDVECWQQGFLNNAVAFAQFVLADQLPDYEWLQLVPEWLEELPVEDLVEKTLLNALQGVHTVVAGIEPPKFLVHSLLDAYPTDPTAVAPMDINSKKHRAKDYRYVYAVATPTRLEANLPCMMGMLELYAELKSLVNDARLALNQFRAHEGSRLNEVQHRAKLHELMSEFDSTEEIARQVNRQAGLRLDYISARDAFRSALTLALQKRVQLVLELQSAVREALDFTETNPVVPTRDWRKLDEKDALAQAISEVADLQVLERMRELLKQPSRRGAAICETRFQRHLAIINCLAADLLLRSSGATLSEYAEHIDDDLSNGEATKEMDRLVEAARKAAAGA